MNEEPHPHVPVMEFSDEEEWQALCAELARLDEFDAGFPVEPLVKLFDSLLSSAGLENAILCILLVCNLNREFRMRNLCYVQLKIACTVRWWAN